MKFVLTCLATLPLVTGLADAASNDEWQSLFDGKTLNGWTPKISGYAAGEDPKNTFVVKDGAIRVSYAGYNDKFGGEYGHLHLRQ